MATAFTVLLVSSGRDRGLHQPDRRDQRGQQRDGGRRHHGGAARPVRIGAAARFEHGPYLPNTSDLTTLPAANAGIGVPAGAL